MSFFHLSKLVGSKEDFADAHEPLNDGVKEVPNAQTVAAGTKTGDVGTDTNSPGPAKVIPEKEDTDDTTEKQFDTVAESAEKGGGDKPTAPKESSGTEAPVAAKSDADTKDTETDSGDGATKAPPFVKKDDAEESEAEADEPKLEHDTAEATDAEIKKTESATKSLEDYSQHAGRFDIIGYPRRDQERLCQTIGFINRRAGKPSNVTKLSLECISEAVSTGKARIESLKRQAEIHATRKVSKENYDVVVEQAITTEPTAHGNEPLAPEVAEQLTELETDPMDLPEIAEIGRIQEAVDTLHGAQVAIEQHLQILRSNKRISKQAAAVLQAGLEHIDQICGLKVRATGMEGYLTTPRAAVEDADVNEKSLTDRAGEIGAKIMKFIRALIEKGKQIWEKLISGSTQLDKHLEELGERAKQLKGTPEEPTLTIANPKAALFVRGEFYGDRLSPDEQEALSSLKNGVTYITRTAVKPITENLNFGRKVNLAPILDELSHGSSSPIGLPGGSKINRDGLKKTFEQGDDEAPAGETKVDIPPSGQIRRNIENLRAYVGGLTDGKITDQINNNAKALTDSLIAYRQKAKDGSFDESEFQEMQRQIVEQIISPFTVEHYSTIVRQLLRIVAIKVPVITAMLNAYK